MFERLDGDGVLDLPSGEDNFPLSRLKSAISLSTSCLSSSFFLAMTSSHVSTITSSLQGVRSQEVDASTLMIDVVQGILQGNDLSDDDSHLDSIALHAHCLTN